MVQSKTDSPLPTENRVIIELHRSAVRLSQLRSRSSLVSFQKSHLFGWPKEGDIPWHDSDSVSKWLLESFASCGILVRSAIICVPRTSVCLRHIEVPPSSLEQIPRLVEMQLEASIGEQFIDSEYDFALLPRANDTPIQCVLAVTISKATLQGIRDVFRMVGCHVETMTVAELAVPQGANSNTNTLEFYASANQGSWDVVVGLAGHAIQIQSASMDTIPSGNEKILGGLINRLKTTVPASEKHKQCEVPVLVVNSEEANDCREILELATKLGYKTITCSRTSAILRMTRRNSEHSINFETPLRAPDLKKISRHRWTKIGVIAASIAAAFVLVVYLFESSRSKALAQVRSEIKRLEKELAEIEPKRDSSRKIREWQSRTVNWATELTKLTQHFGTSRELYVSRAQMESREGDKSPTIRFDGQAHSANDVLQLNRDILSAPGKYAVQPLGIEPSFADPNFPSQFRLEVRVLSPGQQLIKSNDFGATENE